MTPAYKSVIRIYLLLTLLNTLAASFIWGINTLFLLDAKLTNLQAFTANAFFTAGEVLFEIPTGMLADMKGRRLSFLLGTVTLAIATLLYLYMWDIQAPFWTWIVTSILLGLGFTFFSGATEAWLVDSLTVTHFDGHLETVFAKGQIVTGVAMFFGAIAGGFIAQYTNLGVPYVIRTIILLITFVVAFFLMHDIGFHPKKNVAIWDELKNITRDSFNQSLKNKSVRWVILSGPFIAGVSIYVFYAMQPYLLELYGQPTAYGVAGMVAGIIAIAQVIGGLIVPYFHHVFSKRTSLLLLCGILNTIILLIIGYAVTFWLVIGLLILWGLIFSASMPVRQSYINGNIPSAQRATVLSFDSLVSSSGGIVFQPILGKCADVYGYAFSYLISGFISMGSWFFLLLAKGENCPADHIKKTERNVVP